MIFLQDFSKIALFLLLFASIALVFELLYFRRKKAAQKGSFSPGDNQIAHVEDHTIDESASASGDRRFLRGKTLIIIGALVVLLAIPVSVYLVFQQVNPEKEAAPQTVNAVVGCDQLDIMKNAEAVSSGLQVGDIVSFVGYCYVEGGSNQTTITTLKFTATSPSGTVGPFTYFAFAAPEKNHDNRQYVQATYPNVKLGGSGNYTIQVAAFNGSTQLSTTAFSKTFVVASSSAAGNNLPTPTLIQPTQTQAASASLPSCTSLSAIPFTGPAPLAVSLTGSGGSQGSTVSAFEFTFGDGAVQTVSKNVGASGSASTTHVYQNAGSYTATLKVRDSKGNLSQSKPLCSTQITVVRIGGGTTATASADNLNTKTTKTITPTPTVVKLPEAGISLPMVGFLSAGLVTLTLGLLLAF